LKKNYRNTVEIIAVAQAFSSSQSSDLEDHSAHAPEIEGGSSLRSGPTPVILGCESRIAEIEAVTKLVDALTSKGIEVRGRQVLFAPEEIAVFYPRNQDQALFETLCSSLKPFGLARLSGPAPTNSLHDPGVRLITMNASKGLQYRAVILIWADLLPSSFPDRDEARERRLMYVALTRAEDLLYVTHSGPSGYISEIEHQLNHNQTAHTA
jgi:superfamily I DNA/RNA helicase